MSYRHTGGSYTYSRLYSGMRGVSFSPSEAEGSPSHFTDLENMWRDPVAVDSALTESFPGFRLFACLPAPILGIYGQRAGGKSYLIVHAKNTLYRIESRLCDHPKDVLALSPLASDIPEEAGCAFAFGEELCLLIGGVYYRISAEGVLSRVSESDAYIPTTFHNGEPYEQRNLLRDEARHIFTADGDYEREGMEEGALSFEILLEVAGTCYVKGGPLLKRAVRLEIPERATIDGKEYTVVGIDKYAFANHSSLISVSLPQTLTDIGIGAFMGCTALLSVNLPHGIHRIGERAFYGCLSLCSLYIGEGISQIDGEAFAYCVSLKRALYGGNEEAYASLLAAGGAFLAEDVSVTYEAVPPVEEPPALFRYPILDPALEVLGVTLDGTALDTGFLPYKDGFLRYRPVTDGERVTHLELILSTSRLLEGKSLAVTLRLSPSQFATPKGYTSFAEGHPSLSGRAAVSGCRLAAEYDGRIFLSGNPSLPNTVFHTLPDASGKNNPFYVGALSYFNDGTGAAPNRALLGTGSMLVVCKDDEGGTGALYYHTALDTGVSFIPRVYPASSGAAGVGAVGGAINFRDDPVFLGKEGLIGIAKQALNAERSLAVRSYPVNARLLKEDLAHATMAVHEGLLYLLAGGNIYVADSRRRTSHSDGTVGYEWYFLSHIGSHTGDRPLYRTASFLPEGAEAHGVTLAPEAGKAAVGEVYSVRTAEGGMLYYERTESGEKYAVDSEGERTGGIFSPARVLCAVGGRLFFGTEDGALGVFNTDKRGKSLYRLSHSPLFALKDGAYLSSEKSTEPPQSEEALERLPLYEKKNGGYALVGEGLVYLDGGSFWLAEPFGERCGAREIHRYFYTYGGHAYTAACTLSPDDGGFPHLSKDTVPRTAVVKVKTPSAGALCAMVRTDRAPWHICDLVASGSADLGDLDFSVLSFHGEEGASIPLREKERRWCFKQYRFAVTEARRPFGICALAYSYRISGTVKP